MMKKKCKQGLSSHKDNGIFLSRELFGLKSSQSYHVLLDALRIPSNNPPENYKEIESNANEPLDLLIISFTIALTN